MNIRYMCGIVILNLTSDRLGSPKCSDYRAGTRTDKSKATTLLKLLQGVAVAGEPGFSKHQSDNLRSSILGVRQVERPRLLQCNNTNSY